MLDNTKTKKIQCYLHKRAKSTQELMQQEEQEPPTSQASSTQASTITTASQDAIQPQQQVAPTTEKEELQLQVRERATAQLSFAELCSRLERICREVRQRDRKLDVLFPRKLRLALKGSSPYPLFRLLLPHIDIARGNYRIKQSGLARLYVEVLGLDAQRSKDAEKLLRYRQPRPPRTLYSAKKRAITYDWPEVLEDALTGRVSQPPSKLNLGQVNELLDELARALDNPSRRAILSRVLLLFSANEQKWLARIILQDMKLGMREDQILPYFHEQASELFDLTCDLRYVCAALSDTAGRTIDQESMSIRLFRPFTPMLAAMIHHQLGKVEPAMRSHPFALEMKIDGERMLCHKHGNKVEFYSRSATPYTSRYGPLLSPWIISNVHGEKCILDGEVIGWDLEHECFLPFKENRSIATEGEEGTGKSLAYFVFDIVYLDGGEAEQAVLDQVCEGIGPSERRLGSITALPLRLRRDLLEKIVVEKPKKLELVRHERVESTTNTEERLEKLMAAFDSALQNMEEGLMVKDLMSAYVLGEKGRGLQHWVKMKPEYSDQTTNLDVIVLGAYYSEGKRRSGRIASFLIGVADAPKEEAAAAGGREEEEEEEDEDLLDLIPWANPDAATNKKKKPTAGSSASSSAHKTKRVKTESTAGGGDQEIFEPKCFYTLGRVGSGISFAEWEELEKKLPLKEWRGGLRLPSYFKPWKPCRRDLPDLLLDPQASVVLEVKCAEIVPSDCFSAGVTLRFPRIEVIRWDKPWSQCLILPELKEIYRAPTRLLTADAPLVKRMPSLAASTTSVSPFFASPSSSLPTTMTTTMEIPPPSTPSSVATTTTHMPPKPPRIRATVPVIESYRTLDASTVAVQKRLLQGMEICVMGDFELPVSSSSDDEEGGGAGSGGSGGDDTSGGEAMSVASNSSADDHSVMRKSQVEKLVLEYGGSLTGSPRLGETALALAPDNRSLRVKHLIKSGKFDVVKLSYLLRVIRQGQFSPPRFDEYLFMTKGSRERLSQEVDMFGDAFAEPTNAKTLWRCFRQMKQDVLSGGGASSLVSMSLLRQLQQDEEDAEVRRAFQDDPEFSAKLLLFANCCIYFDRFADLGAQNGGSSSKNKNNKKDRKPLPVTRLDHLTFLVRLHGGEVSEDLHVGVTHVVVDRQDKRRFPLIAKRLKALRRLSVPQVEKRVVPADWIDACVKEGKLVVSSVESGTAKQLHVRLRE